MLVVKVLFGIGHSKLDESVTVPDYYGFHGFKHDIPGEHHGHGVFETPEGRYVYHDGKKSIGFKSLDSANEFAEAKRNKFKKGLVAAHNEMVAHAPNLSDSEVDIVKNYTNKLNHYHNKGVSLNEHLHHGIALNEKQSKFVGDLDNVMKKTKLHDDLTVYTGTSKNHAELIRKHDTLNHPGYVSTSLSLNSARAFAQDNGGDIVQIHVPKEHQGLYVSHISDYDGEREFVLPRNTRLKLHRDKEQVLLHDSGTYRVHYATIEKE
jgi:hypothetical protein